MHRCDNDDGDDDDNEDNYKINSMIRGWRMMIDMVIMVIMIALIVQQGRQYHSTYLEICRQIQVLGQGWAQAQMVHQDRQGHTASRSPCTGCLAPGRRSDTLWTCNCLDGCLLLCMTAAWSPRNVTGVIVKSKTREIIVRWSLERWEASLI